MKKRLGSLVLNLLCSNLGLAYEQYKPLSKIDLKLWGSIEDLYQSIPNINKAECEIRFFYNGSYMRETLNSTISESDFFLVANFKNKEALFFLIPLMGWMPTAVDLSSWNSLWTVEKIKISKYHPTMKETLFEFNFGYIISGLLSICFVTLGAFLIFGTGELLEKSGSLFAHQIVELYTRIFGDWSYIIIASSTFSIMFGTCIAVFDGYGRAIKRTTELLFPKVSLVKNYYRITILILITGTFLILYRFEKTGDFIILVNYATSMSFIIAPIIAIFNYKVVKNHLEEKFRPPKWLNFLSISGIIFLIIFSILYLFKYYLFL